MTGSKAHQPASVGRLLTTTKPIHVRPSPSCKFRPRAQDLPPEVRK